MKMKKVLTVLMVLVMTVVLMAGCGNGGDDDKAVKVGILQLMEHPSLNTIRESIIEGLAESGYVDGENMTIEYQNGQNDMTIMKTAAQTFVANECDVIIAIATPAAQAVLSETTEIPIVFAAVTDPVDAGLVDSLEQPGGNVTGTSDEVSAEMIMNLAEEITPGFKTIGALYSSGEDNSASVIAGLKKYASSKGYEVVESAVTNSSEVQQAAQYLADKVDVVYSPIDNTVASAMAVATEVFNGEKIPFYVSADSMVADGGLATYGIDYTVLGKETGKMVAQVLGGESPADIPVKKMSDMSVYINQKTADAIGVEFPQTVLDRAQVLGE
ncbi:MAG: ABC transporter substrate binding protein [Anaerovoracaceae bacterium]